MYSDYFLLLLSKKLSNNASVAELQALDQLLEAHPEWAAMEQNLTDLWPLDVFGTEPAPIEGSFERHLNRLREKMPDDELRTSLETVPVINRAKPSVFRRYAWMAAAASVLVLLGAWWLFSGSNQQPETIAAIPKQEVVTRHGTRTRIFLPDGSAVWLNAGSRILFDSIGFLSNRQVTLEGEGYFDVVKNAKSPFVVHTDLIDIRVLGTAFNVKSYSGENQIEATLIHGSIQVSETGNPDKKLVIMKPNEKLVIYRNAEQGSTAASSLQLDAVKLDKPVFELKTLTLQKEVNSHLETAWVYNRLEFEGEKFGDLARKMERWYNVKIVFEDEQIKNESFRGSFQNESVEQALQFLKKATPFSYTIKNHEISIRSQNQVP